MTVDPAPPTWTILIPTIGQRAALLHRLLDVLLPQVDACHGRVRVLAYWNNGEQGLPHIRQALLTSVHTDYVSFVDDDDLVPAHYVADTLAALDRRPDYVGWRVQYCVDGSPRATCYHSLRHGRWYEADGALYRDISHVNPMRADVAKTADFRRTRPGKAEDRAWVNQLRGRLRTEVYIDKVMYLYLWSAGTSAWQQPEQIRRGFQRPTIDHPHFSWHPDGVTT